MIEQIAELNTSKWIVMPKEFSGLGYSLEIDPRRISNSPAVEKVAKEFRINPKNTGVDYFGKGFIGENNLYEFQKLAFGLGSKMLNFIEINKFIKLISEGSKKNIRVFDASGDKLKPDYLALIKDDILKPTHMNWRGEWIDAHFNMKENSLTHYIFENGKIVQKNEQLDENSLIENKIPGINIDNWIEDPTRNGLPKKNIEDGDSYYWAPKNLCAAGIYVVRERVILSGHWNSVESYSDHGARLARLRK